MDRQKDLLRRIRWCFLGTSAALLWYLLCGMPVSSYAEDVDHMAENVGGLAQMEEPLIDETEEPFFDRGIEPYAQTREYSTEEAFSIVEQRIKAAMQSGEKAVQVSDLGLNKDRFHLVELEYYSPYLGNGVRLSLYYGKYSENYTRISISNPMSVLETQKYFAAIDNEIAQITGQITGQMPAEQKALLVHDYFVTNYEFDYVRAENGTMPDESFKSGGLFYEKTGVCQAYAYGYQYIMNLLGMECYVTTSDAMQHAWNILNVDGAYYHVDCTWDDPVPDRFGGAYHEYFLVSDQAVKNSGTRPHSGWNRTDLVCGNEKYDSAYWREADSPVSFAGEEVYFIKGRSIVRYHLQKQTMEKLRDLEYWSTWGNSSQYYTGVYSGLILYKNELIFNTPKELKKISLDGKKESVVYQPDVSKGYIYGCRKTGGQLQYVLKKDLKSETERYVIMLEQPVQEPVAGRWVLDGNGWWYQNKDGSYPAGMWKEISGKWYFFHDSGYCMYGWLFWGNTWYYLDESGAMATGWAYVDGTWYYLDRSGVMATGWAYVDGTWYYLDRSGAMATGWAYVDGTWYYLDRSGAMATGWAYVDGTWYYLDRSGAMATGWVYVDGTWYYLDRSGAMMTGWIKDGNAWYYMEPDGSMAANRWIGNDYVGGDGRWS